MWLIHFHKLQWIQKYPINNVTLTFLDALLSDRKKNNDITSIAGISHNPAPLMWMCYLCEIILHKCWCKWRLRIGDLHKVLNTCRMSNSSTSNPEPGKNGWLTKGSERGALSKGHKSDLWTPLHKRISPKVFIEIKGQTRLKPIGKSQPEQEHHI